jgi:hypothetical protein
MATSAEQAVKRYTDAMQSGAARQKYLDGIASTTENPMEKAAAAEDLYLRRVQEAVSSGRRREKLLSTPMQRWKDNATKKGGERLATGAAAAVDKVRAHFQKWTPIYQQVSAAVASMPKGTIEDSVARAAAAIRMLKSAAGKS